MDLSLDQMMALLLQQGQGNYTIYRVHYMLRQVRVLLPWKKLQTWACNGCSSSQTAQTYQGDQGWRSTSFRHQSSLSGGEKLKLMHFDTADFLFCHRECNKVAHRLAQFGYQC
jgi:hypothetical protein